MIILVFTCFLLFNPINIVFYFDEKMSDERINLNPRQKKHARREGKLKDTDGIMAHASVIKLHISKK